MTIDGPEARPVAPPRSRAAVVGLNEQWFVTTEQGKREGPFSAAQVARLLEQGVLGWTSQIWREGLKDWRPARRDDLLVFAVASARGMASDTSRVDMLAEILQDDTFVEDESPVSVPRMSGTAATSEPPAMRLEASVLSPAITTTPTRPSWLLRYSTPLIAVLAFTSGVLLTQVSRRFAGPTFGAAEPGHAGDAPPGEAVRAQLVRAAASVPPSRQPAAPSTATDAAPALRARPDEAELRAELARLAPSVHRCARRLPSLEVELVVEGQTGRSRRAQLRARGLRGGRLGCVARALDALQVAPFDEPVFRFVHRYRW